MKLGPLADQLQDLHQAWCEGTWTDEQRAAVRAQLEQLDDSDQLVLVVDLWDYETLEELESHISWFLASETWDEVLPAGDPQPDKLHGCEHWRWRQDQNGRRCLECGAVL